MKDPVWRPAGQPAVCKSDGLGMLSLRRQLLEAGMVRCCVLPKKAFRAVVFLQHAASGGEGHDPRLELHPLFERWERPRELQREG